MATDGLSRSSSMVDRTPGMSRDSSNIADPSSLPTAEDLKELGRSQLFFPPLGEIAAIAASAAGAVLANAQKPESPKQAALDLIARCHRYVGTPVDENPAKQNVNIINQYIKEGEALKEELVNQIAELRKANVEDTDAWKNRAMWVMLAVCVVAYIAIHVILDKGSNVESGLGAGGVVLGTFGIGALLKKGVTWINRTSTLQPEIKRLGDRLGEIGNRLVDVEAHQKVLDREKVLREENVQHQQQAQRDVDVMDGPST